MQDCCLKGYAGCRSAEFLSSRHFTWAKIVQPTALFTTWIYLHVCGRCLSAPKSTPRFSAGARCAGFRSGAAPGRQTLVADLACIRSHLVVVGFFHQHWLLAAGGVAVGDLRRYRTKHLLYFAAWWLHTAVERPAFLFSASLVWRGSRGDRLRLDTVWTRGGAAGFVCAAGVRPASTFTSADRHCFGCCGGCVVLAGWRRVGAQSRGG